jgi:hypothetical protein
MKIDFNKVINDADEAVKLVKAQKDEADKLGAADNNLFFQGEHFGKNGEFWTGPRPADANNPAALRNVKTEFASKNGIKEATVGHRDGVVSREPEWTFAVRRSPAKKGDIVNGVELKEDEKPNPDEQARIRELNATMTEWWNDSRILKTLKEATVKLLLTGRSALRVYIPPSELQEDANGDVILRDVPDMQTALKRIFLLTHEYDQCAVLRDDASMKQIGIFSIEEDGQQRVELTYLDGIQTIIKKLIKNKDGAIVPRTPSSSTVRSVFSEDVQGSQPTQQQSTWDLNGHLTMFEMRGEPLISEQVRQSNKSLNKAKTLRGHNLNLAGFREKDYLNVALPGVLEPDTLRPGGQRFIPDPIQRGASITNSWVGIEYDDGTGKKSIANPQIHESEPSPVSVFIESERADYQDIMEETGQVHKMMAGDATASGESRIQAKSAFGTSLLDTKGEVDSLVRWILEVVSGMAAAMCKQAERFKDLRANADCRIDTGPVLPDEVRVMMDLVDKKIISRARLQRFVGVEDTLTEDEAILEDEGKLEPLKSLQVERAKVNLARDKGDESLIAGRIEEGVRATQESGAVS